MSADQIKPKVKDLYADYKHSSSINKKGKNLGMDLIDIERNRELEEFKNLDLIINKS